MAIRSQTTTATTTVVGEIPDKMYFRIGEVAAIVGVKPYVLRYWETEFPALKPQKSRTRQRMYRRRDVELLLKIKHLLYDRKYTIAGARQLMKRGGALPAATPELGATELVVETSGSPLALSPLRLEPIVATPPAPAPALAAPAEPVAVAGFAPVVPVVDTLPPTPLASAAVLDEPPAPLPPAVAPVATSAPAPFERPRPAGPPQLTFDLKVPLAMRDDLRRGLKELVALCDEADRLDGEPIVHRRGGRTLDSDGTPESAPTA